MRRKDVKTIIAYYYGIPAQRRLLEEERAELEEEYNGLRGTPMDGMPHSSTVGKSTEVLAAKVEANNTWGRIQEINAKTQTLHTDAAAIRECMDAINGRYKTLLSMKYFRRYRWSQIAASMGMPKATARKWHDRALDRLGETLKETPMIAEILGRASRARV